MTPLERLYTELAEAEERLAGIRRAVANGRCSPAATVTAEYLVVALRRRIAELDR